MARGRPNWWVILAVSLALMALLVATAGTTPRRAGHPGGQVDAAARDLRSTGAAPAAGTRSSISAAPTTTTTTTTTVPKSVPSASATSGTSLVSARALGTGAGTPMTTVPSVATTTLPPTTTTTTIPISSQPADRMQTQGYLDPPLQSTNGFGFTGTGAMQISVLWSGTTYLTMTVSCPSGSQSVGGTSAMEASLGDASGNCQATVSEPSSESVALTYAITIGPAGG